MSWLSVVLTVSLAQNVVLVHYLGVDPLPTAVSSPSRAAVVSAGVTGSLVWISLLYWLVHRFVLTPLSMQVLDAVVLAMLIGGSSVLLLWGGTKLAPAYERGIRETVPMIIPNFTVFVAASAIVDAVDTLGVALLAALATGIGLFLALVPLAAIRRELRNRRLPEILRGDASVYIAAALMALAIQQIDRLLQTVQVPIF